MKQIMKNVIVNFICYLIGSTSIYSFCKRLINTLEEYIIDFLHSVNQHPIVSQLVQTRQNKSKEAMQQKSIVDSKSKI